MDVKSLYTNVPVHVAIDLAIETLYMSQEPKIERDTLRRLMKMAVTEVWFMAGTQLYIQRDGEAMGTAMAVILVNLWLKQFEEKTFSSKNTEAQTTEICRKCNKKVTRQGYTIQCASCRIWFHQKRTPFSEEELKRMRTTSWTRGCEVKQLVEAKITGRYVDDVIRS